MRYLGVTALACALYTALPVAAGAQQADTAYARVTYVSGSSAYIDAGERDGVAPDAELDVIHAGAAAGRLRVRFLSPRRAQCEILSGADVIAVGDSVRYVRAPAAVASDTAAVVRAAPVEASPRPPTNALRGRIGLRYFATWQRDSGSGGVSQPSGDVRLEGPLAGIPIEIAIDARGRRTRSVAIDGVVSQTRTSTLVYQSSLAWRSAGGARVSIGRQYAGELASVSLFDGALAAFEGPRMGVGAFAGTQPDVASMGYSTRVREYGAYVSTHSVSASTRAWTLVSGAIGSYDSGQLDREFVFLSGSLSTALLSLYALQEVDYNRGWKRTFGPPALSPTSTYLSARARLSGAISLQAGYDTRRSVRLYRNYLTPDIAFDDAFRTGVWGGLFANLGAATSASLDARRSSGGASGPADIYSLALATRQQWRLPIEARERTSWYDSPAATGWLHTLSVAVSPTDILRVETSGGARFESPAPGTAAAATTTRLNVGWLELNADVALGRSWYLLMSATRERGGWESGDQVYSALSYRF